MTRSFESWVAIRYLRSKRKEVFISIITIISILGVAISVMVLDMVLAIMTGFEAELQAKLINANAHLVIRRYGGNVEDWPALQQKILSVDGVAAAFPYTYSQALLSLPGTSTGVLIRGVADSPEPREKLLKMLDDSGDIAKLFNPAGLDVVRPDGERDTVNLPPIIIGRELRNRLGITVGSPVTLMSPDVSSSPQGLIPKIRRFVVVGIYSSGLYEYEVGLAYTSLRDAQAFFGFGDGVTGVEVRVNDLDHAAEIGNRIIDLYGGPSKSPYYASDWTQPNKALWDAIRLERRVYFFVLLLLILVASFSIVSTLVMVVMEKGKDIAILKTMGARDNVVLRIFLIQGSLIGAIGTVLGTVFGVLGCIGLREYGFKLNETVFALDKVPVHMIPTNFILVFFSGLIITAIAGIYPAWRAARLKPADALRYE